MLTGERPFHAENEQAVLYRVLHDTPRPMSRARPDIPKELERIVFRALEKDPARRFQSAKELVERLEQLRGQGQVAETGALQDDVFDDRSTDVHLVVPTSMPLVGREKELELLHHRLDEARRGSRQVVFVTGEPGLGKTTLVETFLKQVGQSEHLWVGWGQCIEQRGAGEAYMPVLEALGRLCRDPEGEQVIAQLATHAPTWLVQMPWLVAADELEVLKTRVLGTTRERMLREMVEAVEALAAERPVILVLEDLHWSDFSTLDLIDWLARRHEPARLLVIGTFRPADARRTEHPLLATVRDLEVRGCASEVALSLLDKTAIGTYLDGRFPHHAFPNTVVDVLHQRTEGNALFMESVVQAWLEQGCVVKEDGVWKLKRAPTDLAVGVPGSLQQLIEQEVRLLGSEEQVLLEAASVAGSEFSAAAVAAAVDASEEEVEGRCSGLSRQGRFLRSTGISEWPDGTVAERFAFVHHLHQEVLYERLPAGRRVRLHRRIGARLASGYGAAAKDHAAELAAHFVRGREPEQAVRYLVLAAERALRRTAHQEAIEHLNTGLTLLESLPEASDRARKELELQSMLGPSYVMTRGWGSPEAERAFVRARKLSEELNDHECLVPVLYGLATLYEFRGEYRTTQALLEERLGLPEDNGELLLESRELLACSTFHQGKFNQAVDHATQGLTLYDAHRYSSVAGTLGEDPGVACHCWAALSLWSLGYPDQSEGRIRQAIELASDPTRQYSLSHALMKTAFLYQLRLDVDITRERAEATVELARKQGYGYREAVGMVMRGWAMVAQGQQKPGIGEIRAGLRAHQETGATMDRPYFLGLLADACYRSGRMEEALEVLEEAQSLVESSRRFFFEAELHRLRGTIIRRDNDRSSEEEAERAFRCALEVARRQQAKSFELRGAVSLARLLDRQERHREALEVLEPVYAWFTEGFETQDLREAAGLLEQLRGHLAQA